MLHVYNIGLCEVANIKCAFYVVQICEYIFQTRYEQENQIPDGINPATAKSGRLGSNPDQTPKEPASWNAGAAVDQKQIQISIIVFFAPLFDQARGADRPLNSSGL